MTAVLAETIATLSRIVRKEKGTFTACPQLLQVWICQHFLRPFLTMPAYFQGSPAQMVTRNHEEQKDIEEWKEYFRNLSEVRWFACYMNGNAVHQCLIGCGSREWVPLIGPWTCIGHAPSMFQRQFRSRQTKCNLEDITACEYDLWSKEKDGTKWAEIQKFRAHLWSPTSRGRTYTNYLAPTEEYLDWRNQVSVCLPAEGTPRLPRKVKMPKDYVEDYLKEKDESIGQLEDDIKKLKEERGQIPDLRAEIERLMLENSTLRQECEQKEAENEIWRGRSMASETKQRQIMLSKRHIERELGACKAQLKCRDHTLAGYRRRVKDIEE